MVRGSGCPCYCDKISVFNPSLIWHCGHWNLGGDKWSSDELSLFKRKKRIASLPYLANSCFRCIPYQGTELDPNNWRSEQCCGSVTSWGRTDLDADLHIRILGYVPMPNGSGWGSGREAQKHTYPTDPDPDPHCHLGAIAATMNWGGGAGEDVTRGRPSMAAWG